MTKARDEKEKLKIEETKLEKCPFCGGEARLHTYNYDLVIHCVRCAKCEAQTRTCVDADFVISQWNSRPLTGAGEEVEKQIEELKIALADSIRRPMGVMPDSARGILTDEELQAAEQRRLKLSDALRETDGHNLQSQLSALLDKEKRDKWNLVETDLPTVAGWYLVTLKKEEEGISVLPCWFSAHKKEFVHGDLNVEFSEDFSTKPIAWREIPEPFAGSEKR